MSHTLTQCRELWIQRNEIVHGHQKNQQNSEKKRRIHAELDYVYQRRSKYLNKDQELLFDTVADHKELPLTSIQNWLLMYKQHLSESAVLAKKFSLHGVKRISQYFKKK